MSTDSPNAGMPFASNVRTAQIITLAMAMGVLIFAGVALTITLGRDDNAPIPNNPFGFIAVAMGFGIVMARLVILQVVAAQIRRRVPPAEAAPELQSYLQAPNESPGKHTQTLVAGWMNYKVIANALLEGPAFLGLVSFLMNGQWWQLAMPGLMVLMLLGQFPTLGQLHGWLTNQWEQLDSRRRELQN